MVGQRAGRLANQLVDACARAVHRLQDRAEQNPIAFSFKNQQAPTEDQLKRPGIKTDKLKFHLSLNTNSELIAQKGLSCIDDANQQDKQST